MLRNSYTAVVERAVPWSGVVETEPYEVGWATECLVFVSVRTELPEGAKIEAEVLISPDGAQWVEEGTTFSPMEGAGLHFVRVREFGNWLRLRATVEGTEDPVQVSVYLALK